MGLDEHVACRAGRLGPQDGRRCDMRVRAVPELGDRYVGSVEYMGEGRVLVGVEAEGWGSDRTWQIGRASCRERV